MTCKKGPGHGPRKKTSPSLWPTFGPATSRMTRLPLRGRSGKVRLGMCARCETPDGAFCGRSASDPGNHPLSQQIDPAAWRRAGPLRPGLDILHQLHRRRPFAACPAAEAPRDLGEFGFPSPFPQQDLHRDLGASAAGAPRLDPPLRGIGQGCRVAYVSAVIASRFDGHARCAIGSLIFHDSPEIPNLGAVGSNPAEDTNILNGLGLAFSRGVAERLQYLCGVLQRAYPRRLANRRTRGAGAFSHRSTAPRATSPRFGR